VKSLGQKGNEQQQVKDLKTDQQLSRTPKMAILKLSEGFVGTKQAG
jgi:hypothetical protein